MTTTPTRCLECDTPLSPADAHGLCPRCLLKVGLAGSAPTVLMAGTRTLVPPPMFPFDFGGYRMLRLLGRGGMGAVYEAEQRDTGRRVAVKVLGQMIDSEEMRKRFLREGRLAASVNHPNTVYIFGSEEIEGAPVIAMELVAGGTLRDLIRKGSLAVRDAADATLQIIAGLEAAAAAGVLHRDVKPANCFVSPDGTVKVGDFGLSVSTLARDDTQLTASGMMLGTPSFAPPEQLRGDELDVRADIYSVGATLYAMLTGHAPFEGENPVHVVAAVLDRTPKPLAEFRQDVPAGLAQVVGKCLAKKRDDRFADYAALRDSLTPFSSQAREPAPVGLRIVAGMIDLLLATLISAFVWTTGETVDQRFLVTRTLATTLEFFGVMLFGVAYFAIPEGLWGASLGKMLCGLRVVGTGRGAPGIPLAALRALIVMLVMYLPDFIDLLMHSAAELKQLIARDGWTFTDAAGPSFMFLLFVTMRRRNGFAAIHDMLTGTHVVVRPKAGERPRLEAVSAAVPAPDEMAERIGPFRIVAPLAGAWFAAYDDVLRRSVWIRKGDANTPSQPPVRRDLGRAGRLRWIAGAHGENESWDAFNAPTGKPLAELSTQPWAAVRCWLLDLAEELAAAAKDGTLSAETGLGHVFITAEGRALLLDEAWPAATATPRFAVADPAAAQRFLACAADAVLDRTRLPLHARDFLQRLAAAAFDRTSFLIGNLRSLLARPAVFTRWRRLASLALAPAVAVAIGAIIATFILVKVHHEELKWAPYPELRPLPAAVVFYNHADKNPVAKASGVPDVFTQQLRTKAGKYIAGHFGAFIAGPEFETHPALESWSAGERAAVRETVRAHSPVSARELADADDALRALLNRRVTDARMPAFIVVPGMFVCVLAVMCVVQLVSLLLFNTTPGQMLFAFAVVDKTGTPAGRGRMLWRWVVIWLPFLMFAALLTTTILFAKPFDTSRLMLLGANLAVWFAAIARNVARPQRGIHDEVAGTFVVTR